MKNIRTFLILAAVVCFAIGCNEDNGKSGASIYESQEYWFQTGKEIDPQLCDVFYVTETCTFDWTDESGNVHKQADLSRSEHRDALEGRMQRAQSVFGDSANFFSPYYHQVTLGVWLGGHDTVAKYYPRAFEDVKAAFDHYMEKWNGGRKFVLAGFSQGALGVKELVKSMTDEQYSRMVAAYVIGFPVFEADLEQTDRFKPAQGADDTGVTISYNSVQDETCIGPYFVGSKMIINPVSWSTDTEPAQLNEDVSVRIDDRNMVLIVDGVDPSTAFVPEYEAIFPMGCYHMLEIPLYENQLRENAKLRMSRK